MRHTTRAHRHHPSAFLTPLHTARLEVCSNRVYRFVWKANRHRRSGTEDLHKQYDNVTWVVARLCVLSWMGVGFTSINFAEVPTEDGH
jgi:hypothetical protein